MKFHPFAEAFDLLQGDAFNELIEDIKTFGLREKIVLFEGKVLDGRNRFLACQKAGIKNPPTRTFKGAREDALAFVWSANKHRRHDNPGALAIAAARIATLRHGLRSDCSDAPRGASTQTEVAKELGVSRRSVQRARKVVEHGSKELQRAVSNNEVPLTKAAAVVDQPKPQQLAAAKAKPEKKGANLDEHWTPEEDEQAHIEALEKEYTASIDKVMGADDKLVAAHAEIKRQAAEIATLKLSRDGYMNERVQAIQMVKRLRAENDRLRRQIKKAA